ncbi:MAG: hypothetical protein NZ480_02415, partial [Bdellovibrionaceae bacterium]|nr:hypothetical protein [Pseudobdellovibrionaceae bacterium]
MLRLLAALFLRGLDIFVFLYLLSIFFSPRLWAVDIYAIVTRDCRRLEGVIINIQDNKATLIDLKGRTQEVDVTQIQYLLTYLAFENPIEQFNFDQLSSNLLREFSIKESNEKMLPKGDRYHIIGWHLKMLENQVFILDVAGKLHIVDLYSIESIRKLKQPPSRVRPSFRPVVLSYANTFVDCSWNQKTIRSSDLLPVRILSDQIQISSFLEELSNQFEMLRRFAERTFVYSRPVLFNTDTAFGLLSLNPTPQNLKVVPGVYFRFGKAVPFGMQSNTVLGASVMEDVP